MEHPAENQPPCRQKKHCHAHGFTLIELSIVVVIIGLLVGGVLVGQDLIRQAELKRVLGDIDAFKMAVNTFRMKYSGLPGDNTNATTFWGQDAVCPANPPGSFTTTKVETCNGDGDQQIDKYTNATTVFESFRAWQQLANSNLIPGQYTGVKGPSNPHHHTEYNSPAGPLAGTRYNIVWQDANFNLEGSARAGNQIRFGKVEYDVSNSGLPILPALKPMEAYSIDMKIDDGKPQFGNVWAPAPGSTYSVGCTSGGSWSVSVYATTTDAVNCAIRFYL